MHVRLKARIYIYMWLYTCYIGQDTLIIVARVGYGMSGSFFRHILLIRTGCELWGIGWWEEGRGEGRVGRGRGGKGGRESVCLH